VCVCVFVCPYLELPPTVVGYPEALEIRIRIYIYIGLRYILRERDSESDRERQITQKHTHIGL